MKIKEPLYGEYNYSLFIGSSSGREIDTLWERLLIIFDTSLIVSVVFCNLFFVSFFSKSRDRAATVDDNLRAR